MARHRFNQGNQKQGNNYNQSMNNNPQYNPNYSNAPQTNNAGNYQQPNQYQQNPNFQNNQQYQQPPYSQQPQSNYNQQYQQPLQQQYQQNSIEKPEANSGMRITKLVMGVLMIVVSAFIFLQGTVMGIGNSIANNHHTSGSGGVLVAMCYLVAGIVYLASKKRFGLGGDIANCVILVLAWLIAISNADKTYADLPIWGWMAFIIGIGFLIWYILANKKFKNKTK